MNLVQMAAFDTVPYAKFLVTKTVAANTDILYLNSTEGLNIGSKIVVGTINSPTALMLEVDAVTNSKQIKVVPALKYVCEEDAPVTLTLFDQFNIYFGTTADYTQHALLDTIDIMVTRNITTYIDEDITHTPSTFYSYSYYNSRNGIEGNRIPIISSGLDTEITPQYLRENYLYGLDLTEDNGNPLPEGVYWEGIKAGFDWLEQVIGIDIRPRTVTNEMADFIRNEYMQWIYLRTKRFPVREVTAIKGSYYGNDITFPLDWVRLKERAGIINLVPGGSSFASFLIPSTGGILPILNGQAQNIPGFWRLSYTTGFAKGEIPYNLRALICKKAAFMPLNILGDLVGGVAIASKSIGVDGLSQSINTTNSAENAGYSARLRMYLKEIEQELPVIQKYWRPIPFMCV